ncbi:MAG: universal stress protein [Candidatus Rokubacteria bacterium]|nr:universal stress protein [Candidatus Rokubacteria bacterium]
MRVLLASDGSSNSRRATRWLRDFALPADTRVSVLTVATLTEPSRDSQTMRELRERAVAEAHQAAERTAKILSGRWPAVDTLVTQGDPQVEIVRVAEDRRVDMTVLGARGLGPMKRFFVGSTSLAVARYAPSPVAIVRGRPRPVRHVLVSVDGSEGSRAALRFLSSFELLRGTRVSLLHVLQRPDVPGLRRRVTPRPDREHDEDRRKQRADAETVLADAAAVLADAPSPVERLVVEGDPAQEIVRIARRRDVDLVVLGARGLRTLGRLLLGSVSETVLHHAGRPVVIARER